jgi:hypothetical protein
MAIELASDEFQPQSEVLTTDGATKPQALLGSKAPPPQYLVLRSGSTQPERFSAADDGEALQRLQKEVRAGQSPVVYCFKLWVAEEYVAHSRTIQY